MKKNNLIILTLLMVLILTASSCSQLDIKREVKIPEQFREVKPEIVVQPEPQIPDFKPVTEDITPIKTKVIDIIARDTPLRDVLHVIAEATGLNLLIQKEVDLNVPINLTLKAVTVEDALENIFNSVDYFYHIQNNMLVVKFSDTKIFEIGHPQVVHTYGTDIGGDILGSITSAGGGGLGGSGGGSSIKGSITKSIKTDTTASNFWDSLESAIASILGLPTATVRSGSQTPTPMATPGLSQGAQQTVTGPPTTSPTPSATVRAEGSMQGTSSFSASYSINRIAGTVLVTASKDQMKRVEAYINHIKKVMRRQIIIEAKVIEVALSDDLRYGIDWSMITRRLKNTDVSFTSTNIREVIPSATGMPFYTLTVLQYGYEASAILRALQQQGEVRTLSNPRINILNGQTALLSVGRNLSYVSRVDTTIMQGTPPITTYTVTTGNILSGIIIGLVPFVNEYGEISLTITPIISELIRLEDRSIGGNIINLPTVDLKELSTTVKLRDGQMVIIGGLISQKEQLDESGLPFVANTPLIGELFKSKKKTQSKTELVMLLTTHIVSR